MPSLRIAWMLLTCLSVAALSAAGPETPKVERVRPLDAARPDSLPGVFFFENFETISDLADRFQDIGRNDGRFGISDLDPFSGARSIRQEYLPLSEFPSGSDPGSAGWVTRFFGDSQLFSSTIPDNEKKAYNTFVASWYHKFEEGFESRGGYFPNKNARLRCYNTSAWSALYAIYFWTSGDDGHISMESSTRAPGTHREWLPNHYTSFLYSNPRNIGRWIHYEMRVCLGETPRSDRLQAWADGQLICDMAEYNLTGGYGEHTVNAMMWDCYWNDGSPKRQNRFYDDLVMSTQPVGPARTGLNPVIVKSAYKSSESGSAQGGWEIEVALGRQKPMRAVETIDGIVIRYAEPELDCEVVWRGGVAGGSLSVTVDTVHGSFTGPRTGQAGLDPNALHFARVRQRDMSGVWSDWSGWHAAFATRWESGNPIEQRLTPVGYMTGTDAAFIDPDSIAPVIGEAAAPRGTADTRGPYTVTARVSDENLMYVHLYHRAAGDTEYQRIQMTAGAGGVFSGAVPGYPAGTEVQYYIRARDLQWNTTFWPENYSTAPGVIRVLSGDINGDGKVGIADILTLMLRGISNPADPSVDINGDGRFTLADAVGPDPRDPAGKPRLLRLVTICQNPRTQRLEISSPARTGTRPGPPESRMYRTNATTSATFTTPSPLKSSSGSFGERNSLRISASASFTPTRPSPSTS